MAAPSITSGGITFIDGWDGGGSTPTKTNEAPASALASSNYSTATALAGSAAIGINGNTGGGAVNSSNNQQSGALQGGIQVHDVSAPTNLTNALVIFHVRTNSEFNYQGIGSGSQTNGFHVGFGSSNSGTEEAGWVVGGASTKFGVLSQLWSPRLINVSRSSSASFYDDGTGGRGTFDPTDVTHSMAGINASANNQVVWIDNVCVVTAPVLVGGESGDKATLNDFISYFDGLNTVPYIEPSSLFSIYYFPFQIGNGSTVTYFDDTSLQTVEFPETAVFGGDNSLTAHIDDNDLGLEFNCASGAGNYYRLRNKTFISNTPYYVTIGGNPANWEYMACTFIGAGTVTIADGFQDRSTWDDCGPLQCSQPTFNTATIRNATGVGLQLDTSNGLTNCTNLTITGCATGIEVTAVGNCSIDITNHNIAGNNTSDIHYDGASTLTVNCSTAQSGSLTTTGTGTISVVTPTDTLTVTSSESGSLIQVFTTNTQTILDSTTGTSLAYDHSAETVDIVVQKAGFIPQRRTGIALSGSPTQAFELVADPAYNASHGLTITTDYSYDATTRVTRIVAPQQGRDVYSALIDSFISETAYRNKPFPITAVGIDRFDFTSDGTTPATIHADDILNWLGAGMTWEHATSGNPTRKYCFVKGTGTNAAGTKGYFQHTDGATPDALTLVSNNINQVIQYYSDPNGDGSLTGGYDRPSHAVVKLFNDGYYQASANILTAYDIAELEPQEYIVPMQMVSTGLGTGDRSITLTVTDNTPAGVEEQTGYTFDYKIEGGASDSPEDILRQWIYDVYTDPTASTYASKINFNWPDPILETGGNYETKRGIVYGQDTTTTLHGFYVEEGTDYHPDFTRQQSNDGTYFVPDVTANISITGMPTDGANIRLQVANVTAEGASAWEATTAYSVGDIVLRTSGAGSEQVGGLFMRCTTAGTTGGTEPTWDTTIGNTTSDGSAVWTTYGILHYNNNPSSSAYSDSYIDGEEFASGESYRIRFAELNGATSFKSFQTTGVAASSGFSVVVSVTADDVYATNAVNGASLDTTFSPNFVTDRIVLDTNTDYLGIGAYAYYCYTLTTSQGMYDFWGGVTALDVSNYRINDSIVNIYFDETAGFVKQLDSVRIFRADGNRPALDPTTGGSGLEINWRLPVYAYDGGGGGFTSADRATLAARSSHSASDVVTSLMAEVMEGSETFKEQQNIIRAQSAGKVSVSGATVTFRDASDSKARITATVDANGQRTAVTTDGA